MPNIRVCRTYPRLALTLSPFASAGEGDVDFDREIELDSETKSVAAALFVEWNSAYDAVTAVVRPIRDGQNVNVELLLPVISPTLTSGGMGFNSLASAVVDGRETANATTIKRQWSCDLTFHAFQQMR
jgi:hypothetical protein